MLKVSKTTGGSNADHIQPFALSLNAPFIPQFFKEQLDQTAPYWDYIVGNETEAASYAESHDLKTTDIPTIAKHLANLPKKNEQRKRIAIITQGTEPTVVAIQGEDNVKTFPVHEINKSDIRDTTGAGDAFAAGFFAGVAKGEALHKREGRGTCTPHRYPRVPSNHHTFNNEAPSQVISPHTSPHTSETKKHTEQSAKHKSVLQMPRQHERWQRRRKHCPAHRRRQCLAQGSDICDERGQ